MAFQKVRSEQIRKHWLSATLAREDAFQLDTARTESLLQRFEQSLPQCQNTGELMAQEAVLTKALYKLAATAARYGDFTRAKRGGGVDVANLYLDHGNYLAYGLAATAVWVIGLPHGLAVMHGKTRRGGLVFDVADLIKDALILPQAFIAAMNGEDEQEFRQRCLSNFQRADALDVMIETVQDVAHEISQQP